VLDAHFLDLAACVPTVGPLGDDAHHLWPVRANRKRWARLLDRPWPRGRVLELVVPALVAHFLIPEQPVHHLDGLPELLDPLAGRQELQPIGLVLGYVPARADAELQAAIRDVVNGNRLLHQQARVAEGIASDQHADPNPFGAGGQAGQLRPGFVVRTAGPRGLLEVVTVPDAVEAQRLEIAPALYRRWPVHVLVGADTEAQSPCHCSPRSRPLPGRPFIRCRAGFMLPRMEMLAVALVL